jgi:hypothetical protein
VSGDDLAMHMSELRAHLNRLQLEWMEAVAVGLGCNETYMADLETEIAEARVAFVEAVVIEIAVARAELSGRLFG